MHNRWRLDRHHRVGPLGWFAAAITIAILISLIAAKSAHGAYLPVTQWGNAPIQGGEFEGPTNVATDPAGNVYVLDGGGTGLVQKFDANGNFLTMWGGHGTTDGNFLVPLGIAADAAGNVYVVDNVGNVNVQKFDSNGNFLTKWGGSGSGDGQFSSPKGIAVDPSGNVYVMDSGNSRVQKFTSSGTFITKWGSFGTGNGQFQQAYGIATDSASNVYVTSTSNGIQKFTSTGGFLAKWNGFGYGLGVSGGIVTVASGNFVNRYDAVTGGYLSTLANFGSGDGEVNSAFGVAIGTGGQIYLADGGNYRIQRFDSSGSFTGKWGIRYRSADGQFRVPTDVAVDGAGNVYVADRENSRVQKFDGGGTFAANWGSAGTDDGQFRTLRGIAADSAGNVYTTEVGNSSSDPSNRVQKFDSSGNVVTTWGGGGTGPGEFTFAYGIAVSPLNGRVYVTDGSRVEVFEPDGTFVSTFGSSGSGPGQFSGLRGIGIDAAGNVYVADNGNGRVQKFGPTGTFVAQWPVPLVSDVVVDGNRVLAASYQHVIYQFTTSGSAQGQFGVLGSAPGQFNAPEGLAVNSESDLYVADQGNNRVQMLRENQGYPRAKAATPLYAPLVPAYDACAIANRQHAGPLNFGSCSPPVQTSAFATAGTPDANAAAANMVGFVRLRVLTGNASTAADEADVELTVDVTDVRNSGGLTDYTGELGLSAALRTTDRLNGLARNGPATGVDADLSAPIGCASTPDTSIGSTCSLTTTLDTLVPGMVAEGARSIWRLGQIGVLDGGPDGDADTPTGNTVFARQGVFVP
jgi:DNA-binding beta-propeller fold protein YncE